MRSPFASTTENGTLNGTPCASRCAFIPVKSARVTSKLFAAGQIDIVSVAGVPQGVGVKGFSYS